MSVQNKHTFLLKGVNPIKLMDEYKKGVHSIIPDNVKKFPLEKTNKLIASMYSSCSDDPIYSMKDKNNNTVIIATTGSKNYELYMENDGDPPPVGGICDFCKCHFDHQNVGYPIAHEEYTLLVNSDNPHYTLHYVFWMYGETCSLSCSLSEIRKLQGKTADFRDSTSRNSEYMLHKLFKLMYPNEEVLRPSQDPKLLITNKGSLTREEWQDHNFLYKKTDRVLMMPIKMEYLQKTIY